MAGLPSVTVSLDGPPVIEGLLKQRSVEQPVIGRTTKSSTDSSIVCTEATKTRLACAEDCNGHLQILKGCFLTIGQLLCRRIISDISSGFNTNLTRKKEEPKTSVSERYGCPGVECADDLTVRIPKDVNKTAVYSSGLRRFRFN
jgi:hypothetical protein